MYSKIHRKESKVFDSLENSRTEKINKVVLTKNGFEEIMNLKNFLKDEQKSKEWKQTNSKSLYKSKLFIEDSSLLRRKRDYIREGSPEFKPKEQIGFTDRSNGFIKNYIKKQNYEQNFESNNVIKLLRLDNDSENKSQENDAKKETQLKKGLTAFDFNIRSPLKNREKQSPSIRKTLTSPFKRNNSVINQDLNISINKNDFKNKKADNNLQSLQSLLLKKNRRNISNKSFNSQSPCSFLLKKVYNKNVTPDKKRFPSNENSLLNSTLNCNDDQNRYIRLVDTANFDKSPDKYRKISATEDIKLQPNFKDILIPANKDDQESIILVGEYNNSRISRKHSIEELSVIKRQEQIKIRNEVCTKFREIENKHLNDLIRKKVQEKKIEESEKLNHTDILNTMKQTKEFYDTYTNKNVNTAKKRYKNVIRRYKSKFLGFNPSCHNNLQATFENLEKIYLLIFFRIKIIFTHLYEIILY